MKFLFLCLFLAFNAKATVVDLNSEKLNLGELSVGRGGLATSVFNVRRSLATPDEVDLVVSFNKDYHYCKTVGYRRVWVPGDVWGDCSDLRCRPSRTPGHYETEQYCREYGVASRKVSQEINLDFDDATTLLGNEEEVFTLSLVQKDKMSDDFALRGAVVRAVRAYEIKQKGDKNKLKFETVE